MTQMNYEKIETMVIYTEQIAKKLDCPTMHIGGHYATRTTFVISAMPSMPICSLYQRIYVSDCFCTCLLLLVYRAYPLTASARSLMYICLMLNAKGGKGFALRCHCQCFTVFCTHKTLFIRLSLFIHKRVSTRTTVPNG